MALIREECCSFGMQLMAKLSVALAQGKLASAKDAAAKAKKQVLDGKALLEEWMKACEGNEHLQSRQEKKEGFRGAGEEGSQCPLLRRVPRLPQGECCARKQREHRVHHKRGAESIC